MTERLPPRDIAGVLDQLYRGASGLPRRYFLRSQELRALARRRRGLRPEFFQEVADQLATVYSILMSYPRLSQGGLLAFAAIGILARWPLARDQDITDLCAGGTSMDWVETVRTRITRLINMNSQSRALLLTEHQLCRLAGRRRFDEKWWLQIINSSVNVTGTERLVFFADTAFDQKSFVIAQEDYAEEWFHPVKEHWIMAERRFMLHEDADDDMAPIGDQAKLQWQATMSGARLSTTKGGLCPCDRGR